MDKYKKKSLKFQGMGRELRTIAINANRADSRHARLSLLRFIEPEQQQKENISNKVNDTRKIPTFGKPKVQVSRLEMLQKWKQEKVIKRQHELKSKKPAFKAGIILPQAPLVFSKNDKTLNSFKSKDSCVQMFSNSKNPVVSFADLKTRNKEARSQTNSNYKPPVVGVVDLKTKSKTFSLKPPVVVTSNLTVVKNKTSSLKPPVVVTNNLTVVKNKESKIQGPSKPQGIIPKASFTSTEVKSKIHSGLPKIAESRILKKPEQQISSNSLPRRNHRIPESKTNQLQQKPGSKLAKSTIKVPTQIKPPESRFRKEVKPERKFKSPPKATISTKNMKAVKQDLNNVTFGCELSHIAPKTPEKSFAPKGFQFCPSSSLHCSLFMEDGPASIFAQIKQETGRTSTPKRSEWHEEVDESIRSKTEDSLKSELECEPSLSKTEDISKKELLPYNPHVPNIVVEAASSSECKVSLQSPKEVFFKAPEEVFLEPPEQQPFLLKVGMPETEDCTTLLMEELLEETDKSNPPLEELDVEQHTTPKGVEPMIEQHTTPETIETSKIVLSGSDIETFPQAAPAKIEEVKTGLSEVILAQIEEKISVSHFATSVEEQYKPATRSRQMEIRSFRRSEKPQLASISESLENTPMTPKSRMKKSARKKEPITPRRSMRLAKLSSDCGSPENLFNVRPSLCGSSELDDSLSTPVACRSNLTYDFDNLHLESTDKETPVPQLPIYTRPTRTCKVSLLYTPPPKGRRSVLRKSIKGDLMSFSPDV